MKVIKYEVKKYGTKGDYKLVSIVETNFGGPGENYVMSGCYDECVEMKKRLEKKLDETKNETTR